MKEKGAVDLTALIRSDHFGVAPASSYSFLQDLRRAKAASLADAQQTAHRLAAQEDAMIRAAQQASLEDAAKRQRALCRLEKRLACPWNLRINHTTDDQGNCQFDSAADQLKRYPEFEGITKEIVRARTVEWLRNNKDYKLSAAADAETLEQWISITQGLTWPAYCAKMAKDKQWGDEVTMKAITEEFQARIFLWSSTVSESNYFSEHVPRNVDPIGVVRSLLMCHVLEVHYCPLIMQASSDTVANELKEKEISSVPPDAQVRLLQTMFKSDNNELSASLIERIVGKKSKNISSNGTLLNLDADEKSKKESAPATATNSASSNDSVDNMTSEFVVVEKETGSFTLTLCRGWHSQHTWLVLFFEAPIDEVQSGDWIGLYDVNGDNRQYLNYWKLADVSHGIYSYFVPRRLFGTLHFRYMRADYTEVARSGAVTHGPRPTLAASCEGDKLLVTWRHEAQLDDAMSVEGLLGTPDDRPRLVARVSAEQRELWLHSSDWLGLYKLDDNDDAEEAVDADVKQRDDGSDSTRANPINNKCYIDSLYIATNDAATFTRPTAPGRYEVRYFSAHRQYHCLARTQFSVGV